MFYMTYKDALTVLLYPEENQSNNSETNNDTSSYESFSTASQNSEEQNFEISFCTSVDPTMQDAEKKDSQSLDETSSLFAQSIPCYGTFTEESQTLAHIRVRVPTTSRLSKEFDEEDLGTKDTLCVQQRSCFKTPRYTRIGNLPHLDNLSEVLDRQYIDNEKDWSFSQSKPCFELEHKVSTASLQPKIRSSDWDEVHDRYIWDQLLKAPVLKTYPAGNMCRVTGEVWDTANLQGLVLTDLPQCQCKSAWETILSTEVKSAVASTSIDATEWSGALMWSVALSESVNDSYQGSILREPCQEIMLQDNVKGTSMHQRTHVTQLTNMPQRLECVSGNNHCTMLQICSDFASGNLSTTPSVRQADLDSTLFAKSETLDKSLKAEACGEKDSFYESLIHSLSWGPDEYIQPTDITVYLASTGGTGGNWHPNLNSSTLKEFLEKGRKGLDVAELLRNQYDGPGIAKWVDGQGNVMTQEHSVFASDSSTENSPGVQGELPVQGDVSQGELSFLRRAWKRCKEGWKKICPKAQWEKRRGVDKNE